MLEMTCTLFCVILVSVPLAVLKLKTGVSPPPHLDRNKQKQDWSEPEIGLDRVSTCLADRAVVTEFIITGSTDIIEPRVAKAEGQ